MKRIIKALSLFSSAGIGELNLKTSNIDVIVANELLPARASCYSFFYPTTNMLCGDIQSDDIKKKLISLANDNGVQLLIATPPCQGFSTLGKNKVQQQYEDDRRNYLVFDVMDIIDQCNFNYIIFENVPKFIDMLFPYEGKYQNLGDILKSQYASIYDIDIRVLNAKDYGVPQSRPRSIIKMWKKGLSWEWPEKEKEITLKEAIGHLPSLEPGEDSGIKWHKAKQLSDRIIEAIRHTAPGTSALTNPVYYPKKADGSRIKGFHNTYKRMIWEQPCPARTTYSGSVSSHNNIHPGRKLADGTYSDARVLTLLEIFIVSSISQDIVFPENVSETFIRTVIGEAVPPRLMERILTPINSEK